MIIYPDRRNAGAEICLNNGYAWRRWPDGRREMLSARAEARWFRKLRKDNEAAERAARERGANA